MNRLTAARLKPRKTPQQARSTVTIEAIFDATLQVLLADGVGKLTTTRVAERAGVSVGTMYQYFPHKQALLFAIVERQLETVISALHAATERLAGKEVATVAEGLARAWLDAKVADAGASRAIYGMAAEFDLGELMQRGMRRMTKVIGDVLAAAPDARFRDIDSAAFMIAAVLGGSVRVVMEADPSDEGFARLREELPRACRAYLAVANGA